MHIGHAKAFGLDYFLSVRNGGEVNMRFDDTNPAKESMEFVDAMLHDIKWLGMNWNRVLFASDYYEQLYEMAVGLIKNGLAYVDDQTAEQISATRGTFEKPGTNSPYRDRSADENLELFAHMRTGKFADGARVLRAKIDMANPNMNLRDPVMYRIMREHHYRTGDKWCIYPMYDFAHPLSDAIENISHSICSFEFEDHRPLYDWFVKHAGFTNNPPRQFEFSRMNIERTVLSKRWLKRFVDEKLVDGWDDPRMPTISGMRRKGYPAKAIMDFVMSTGVGKTPMTVPLSALEFYVRSELDPIATRASVVFNPIRVVITNWSGAVETLEIANNPHNESAGTHKIHFGRELYIDSEDFSDNPPPKYKRLTVGGTVRLRGGYIIKCIKKHGDHLECEYIQNSRSGSDTSGVKPDGVIHFVEATTATPATVRELFPLLNQGIDLTEENLNPQTLIQHTVYCEDFLKSAKPGDKFQFVRHGFFCCDTSTKDGKLVFNKTVGLKEGF
jgi:glutaminyl-tRNA synthetase